MANPYSTGADAQPTRFRTRVLRTLRFLNDAGRAGLDRLQWPSQYGLLQCAVRPGVDEVYELLGCGAAYVEATRHSCFTAEAHVRYLRELHAGDPVRVTLQLLDFDAKRLHYFEQLFHVEDGFLSATSENMALHVDMAARKTAAFPDSILNGLARMKAAHAGLARPLGAGRRIAMRGD